MWHLDMDAVEFPAGVNPGVTLCETSFNSKICSLFCGLATGLAGQYAHRSCCVTRWVQAILNQSDVPEFAGTSYSIMRETTAIRFRHCCIALILLSVTGSISVAAAQDAELSSATPEVVFSLEATSRLGNLTYVPGEWGEFLLRLENEGNTAEDLLCTSSFDGFPGLQYGRKVWVPAYSRLVLPHPVLFPAAGQFPENRAIVRSLVIDDAQGKEVLVKNSSGQLQHERTLLLRSTARNTGIVSGWDSSSSVPQDIVDLVVANRVYQGLDNQVTFLAGQFLPADEMSLRYLDHLVITEDRLIDDLAALSAIRRWLHAGGRLWVMLDRTGPAVLERLLGDEFQGGIIDHVELTSVRVDQPPSVFVPDGVIGETVNFEEPVLMSRATISGMKVWHTVNGWPAALTTEFGAGRLLVTTLGARGWVRTAPAIPDDAENPPPSNRRSDFVPLPQMEDIAPWILAVREEEPLTPTTLEAYAQEYISQDVPTWTLIIGSMAGFLALMVATGTGLWRWGRLEHFGWVGSLLAAGFGIVFLWIGVTNRHGTPETIASVQLAQAISGTDDIRTHGAIAVYRSEGGQSPIRTSHGGEYRPDTVSTEGTTSRMVTTDLGAFHWEGKGLEQPAGIKVYPVATSGAFREEMVVYATLTALGVTGMLPESLSAGTDAIVATQRGRIGVQAGVNGNFTAEAEDVLEANQFLDADILDDVKDRRRRILQQLFTDQRSQASLHQPKLMLWLNEWEHGFEFGNGLQHQGDTLVIAPLQFTRPPSGSEVLIPAPLLGYSSRRPPDGSSVAGFWDDKRQLWVERAEPSTTWLGVHVPHAFLPLQANHATVEIDVSGLMGQIELLAVKDGSAVRLETVKDPVGTLTFEIDDPEVLTVSDEGEWLLGVRAGVPEESGVAAAGANTSDPANYWQIDSLSVQLQATIVETEFVDED
jgi:hypothetical protein